MNLTEKWLKERSACSDGIKWFLAQKEKDGLKVVKKLIKEQELDWANWLVVRLMNYKQYVSYAVYAAELVLPIYEKKHPGDNRPREAIEAAKKCIDNPSEENKKAAATAADAVYAAYVAAYADYAAYDGYADAVYAAYAAAYAAATAAVYAAYAAYAAAYADYDGYAAAYAAAAAATAAVYAADAALKTKIPNYGIKLLAEI